MSADVTVQTVKVPVVVDSSGAKSGFNDVAEQAGGAASKIKAHFSSIFSSLGNNEALGPIMGTFQELSGMFDGLGEKASGLGDKVTKIGTVAAGVGGALTMMAQGGEQADNQLSTAFKDAGFNIDDYKGKIDDTVGTMAKYGYTSVQTKQALQTLVQATKDPSKAISEMGLASNLAAAQHISLGEASMEVSKIISGKGTRTLAQFGISVKTVKGQTTDWNAVLNELSQRVAGQASAASDTWKGHLEALKAEITNHVEEIGQKYGPAITAAGAAMAVAGQAANGLQSIMGMLRGGTEAATAAQDVLTASQEAGGVAADGLAVGETAADTAGLPLIVTIGLIVAAVALVAAGIYELVTHWHTVFGEMKAVVADCWHFIDSNFVQPIKEFFSTIVVFIQAHWQLILSIITGPVGAAVIFVITHFQQIVDFFTALPGAVFGAVLNFLNGMEEFGVDIVKFIVQGIESMGGAIFDAIKSHIPGSGVVGSALNAVGLAEGGIVTKPTLAVIGEAGYPEAVIPLKNGVGAKGFNDSVGQLTNGMFATAPTTNNSTSSRSVTVNAFSNADPQQIASEVTWAFGRLVA